ncbi:hypothetical protein [Salinibacterium sp. ZJ454]|uniref:hypothetical protein n=1 Tax=Salinibacterium sp. ZJ454 TaxID=2708339 RepID=UPI00141F9AE7|nr:hypothetical protein [Salinibacterium sp. ZJ454]
MTTLTAPEASPHAQPTAHPTRSRSRISGTLLVLALLWSAGYVGAGIGWSLTSAAFPFTGDTMIPTFLELMPPPIAAALIGVIAAVGLGIAVWLLAARGAAARRPIVLRLYAGALVAFVTFVAVDARLMAFVGYTLSLKFDLPRPDITHQGLLLIGALLWLGVAVTANRGRTDVPRGALNGRPVSPWARVAAVLALLVPALYAFTRLSWALGFPIGLPADVYEAGVTQGLWWTGLGLALVAIGAGLLTLGLVQRWGEVFPRWIPGLRGRSVPVMLAVVPGIAASLVILSGGLTFVRTIVTGLVPLDENWTTIGPELIWPLWGAAVGVATLAYYRRRTGR